MFFPSKRGLGRNVNILPLEEGFGVECKCAPSKRGLGRNVSVPLREGFAAR